MDQSIRSNKHMSARAIAQIGILATISYFLRFIEVPLPIFPPFLKIDLSDVVAVFGGLSLGPMEAFFILLIKNFLQFLLGGSTTGGVGEMANVVISGAYVLVVCLCYKKSKGIKSIIIGSILGTIGMIIAGCVVNYYVVFPLYAKIMIPMDQIIQMGAIINPRVTNLFTFMIWLMIPFNLLKGTIMTVAILPLYKKISKLIHL